MPHSRENFELWEKNIFEVQRVSDELICPVRAVEAYVCAAELMGLNMNSGYLFRPLGKNKFSVLDGCLIQ